MAVAVKNPAQNPHKSPSKMGRPTIYKAEFCEQVVELGKLGKSRCQIAAVLDVAWNTLSEWEKRIPDFSNALNRAREHSQAWWEQKGQDGVDRGSDFNANAYSLQVRNRFPQDWRDKQDLELSGAGGGPIQLESMSVEAIKAELARRGAIQAEVVPDETPQEPAKICQSNGSLVVEKGVIEAEIVIENTTSETSVD